MPNGKMLALGLATFGAVVWLIGMTLAFGPLVLIVAGGIAFAVGAFGVDV